MGRKSLIERHPARRVLQEERCPAAREGCASQTARRYRIGARPEPKAVKIRVIRAFQLPLTSGKSPTET